MTRQNGTSSSYLRSAGYWGSILVLVGCVLFAPGCNAIAVNARMLHYRATLAGSIGHWTTADVVTRYGQPQEQWRQGDGRAQRQHWVYHLKAKDRRGYDDLYLTFDSDGYLCSWDVNVSR